MVVDGDRVVSTATLLDETVTLGGVELPAGQVELVATDRDYEGRGLVRALMGWCHARSAALGQVVNVMVGIPYFYRQFGYEYAVPIGRDRPLRGLPSGLGAGFTVRRATPADLGALASLERAEQAGFDLTDAALGGVLAMAGRPQRHAGVGRRGPGWIGGGRRPDDAALGGCAAWPRWRASRRKRRWRLAAHAVDVGGGGEVLVKERPGTCGGDALAPWLAEGEKPDWYYVRVPDPVALLERLRPVFEARLAAAGLLAGEPREVLLSCWRWHVRFAVGPEGVGPMRPGGPEQRPISKGGSGWPPDGFASLVFGPYGAVELERRLPDAFLGRQEELMAALFPPIRADLTTFFLP